MTVSRPVKAKVKLTLKAITFVTSMQDVERGPTEQYLLVDQEVLQKMVGWAEALGWRQPTLRLRHLPRPSVAALVKTIRLAIEAEPAAPSSPRAKMSAQGMMSEHFAIAQNRRQLTRVLDFLGAGGELTVEEV